jgi:hypothetical protein
MAAAAPASAAPISVRQGTTFRTAIFPNDRFTVRDRTQLTGRRVNLRVGIDYPGCDQTNYSVCDSYAMLNKLDGFDLQPRVTIPFTGPIDVSSVNDTNVFVQGPGGRTKLEQLVWDPATNVLAGTTNGFLTENRQYRIVVTSAVKDASGHAINACGGRACLVTFTTRTASEVLDHIRKGLDNGSAYTQAGITSRKAGFVQDGTADVFLAASVPPSVGGPVDGIVRLDQTTTDPNQLQASVVPNLINPATVSYYAFGSFLTPRYQFKSADNHHDDVNGNTDGVIPAVPTTQTAKPFGNDRIGFVLILPAGPVPAGGWPVAIYGPGFTRSKYDIFVSADHNAALGIATIATDPSGHAYGPNSKVTVKHSGSSTTFLGYGRGRDLDGDGIIGSGLNDGVGPTAHKQGDGIYLPSRKPIDGLQSGLVQTTVDNMALARSIQAGMDVPGVGSNVLSHSQISYYGISFGGIYGTMVMGTDPQIARGLLSVPGGPIVDIARLSGFRGDLATALSHGKPDIRNGGPGLDGFTESFPSRVVDPAQPSIAAPMANPAPGSILLQELFGSTNWYDRSGSPETFAPLLRQRPLPGQPSKQLLFQTAYGDQTTTDVAAGTIYRAGDLFDLVTFYRNDKSPTYNKDPHGFLADPTIAGRSGAQQQLGVFLQSGTVTNPDPTMFEVPVSIIGNLNCLHYPDPQTGQTPNPQPNPPETCPTRPEDLNGGFEPPLPMP